MKLINADELEPDTEWDDYYDDFVSYSQSQINEAEEVKAIPVERIKQARKEMYEASHADEWGDMVVDLEDVYKILDKLIEEVEG